MSVNLNVNGVVYRYPETGDTNWGQVTTLWAQAVTNGMLQKAGGNFTLTADVDFGGNFGIITKYVTSRTSNPAVSGAIRLAQGDAVSYRNFANSADLALSSNVSDQLTFNGAVLLDASYSNIVNANISASAAIVFSKMAALTVSRAIVSDASGVIIAATTTSTEIGYVNGVTSAIQTQLNSKLNLSGGTMVGSLLLNGDPTLALEPATKQYVDNAMLGLSPKVQVVAATVVNGTFATAFDNGSTVDGIVLATNDRLLIKNQTLPEENGIYIVQASGAPTRATDADTWAELVQAYVLVTGGNTNEGAGFLCTASPGGTINVDPVVFVQFSASTVITTDGEGIELTGQVLSLELDGVTLTKSASGLRLAAAQVTLINAALPNPLTTTGDLIYSSSGTTGAVLPIGSTGQVLSVVAGVPSWVTSSLNPIVVAGSTGATLTAADSNKVYIVNTGSARSFTLPVPASGLSFYIKDGTGTCATNNITIIRNASEQIEGIAASKIFQTNWGSWRIVCDGTNWFIL